MITIMIPTKNRSDFLARLLHYYADTNFKHRIYIGDSSNSHHSGLIEGVVKKLKNRLNITHFRFPNIGGTIVIGRMVKEISTPYATHIGDVDFVVPKALEQCMDFLQKHPDYSAAHGIGIQFAVKTDGPYGDFIGVSRYAMGELKQETALERFLAFLPRHFVTLFSVLRSNTWREMFKDVEKVLDRALAGELLPCCISAIEGKIKQLDCLHIVRQAHGQRLLPLDTYDWITSPNWLPSFQAVNSCLTQELVKQDDIDMDKARAIVRQAFQAHLSYAFSEIRGGDRKVFSKLWNKTKLRLRRIPIVSRYLPIWSKVKPAGGISLLRLLTPTNKYHDDFMPVYQSITKNYKANTLQIEERICETV